MRGTTYLQVNVFRCCGIPKSLVPLVPGVVDEFVCCCCYSPCSTVSVGATMGNFGILRARKGATPSAVSSSLQSSPCKRRLRSKKIDRCTIWICSTSSTKKVGFPRERQGHVQSVVPYVTLV